MRVFFCRNVRAADVNVMYQVGLLMYPVLCTMLLRVFDCRSIEGVDGTWLRADRAIKCQSDQYQNYRVSGIIFSSRASGVRR